MDKEVKLVHALLLGMQQYTQNLIGLTGCYANEVECTNPPGPMDHLQWNT